MESFNRAEILSRLLTVAPLLLLCLVQGGHGSPEIECNSNLQHVGSLGRHRFYISTLPLSWHDANDTCRAYTNTYLASVPDRETKELLLRQSNPTTGHWFGAHEIKFANWTWLNDQIYYGQMSDYTTEHIKSTCGVVNPENLDHLGQSACFIKRRFLCVKSDADFGNLRRGDYYVSTKIEYQTWFQARNSCQCRGMDLAVGNGNSTDFMYSLLNGTSEVFWVGLQKTRYVFEKTRKNIDYLPFGQGEPNDWKYQEDCAEMYVKSYNDNSCDNKRLFFCMWENVTAESGGTAKQHKPLEPMAAGVTGEEVHGGGGMTAAVVLTVVAVIVVVVVVTLVVLKVKAGRDGSKWGRFSNTEEDAQETDMTPGTH